MLSVLAVSGDDALGELLTAGPRFGIKGVIGRMIGERTQGEFAAVDAPPEFAVPRLIALSPQSPQLPIANNIGGRQQRPRDGIDAADMSQIQIRRIHRLAPQFGVDPRIAALVGMAGKVPRIPSWIAPLRKRRLR